jgi:hypothetical protein
MFRIEEMALRFIVFIFGITVVISTLLSAVKTFVLPRGAPDTLTRIVFLSMRRLFSIRLHWSRSYLESDAIMALFAPLSLLMLLPIWYAAITLGYTCLYWAAGTDIYKAFQISGSSLFTLGYSAVEDMPRTILVLSESGIGLLLVALLIAYLPTIYAAFSRRETAVTLMEVRAGTPPSAVELLKRYHRIHGLDQLNELWESWEVWFADIEESHTSLPALVFFRSPRPDQSWVTAGGVVLDSASLALSVVDIPSDPQAALCIRAGFIAFRRISDYFGIPYNPNPRPEDPISISRAEFDAACEELAEKGVPLKSDREAAWRAFNGWRVNYDTVLLTLAGMTMAPEAPWTSDRVIDHSIPLWRKR